MIPREYIQTKITNDIHEKSLLDKYSEISNVSDLMIFYNAFRHSPKEAMVSNMGLLIKDKCNKQSLSLYKSLIQTTLLSDKQLQSCKDDINKNKTTKYNNEFCDILETIDNVLEKYNSIDYLKEISIESMYANRIEGSCLFESYWDKEFEIIMYNINYSPETIDELVSLIRDIKTSNTNNTKCFPKLLIKSTEMISILNKNMSGDVLELITSIPEVISEELIRFNTPKSQIKNYIKLYNVEISKVEDLLKTKGRSELYNVYRTYLSVLVSSVKMLERYIADKKITETSNNICGSMESTYSEFCDSIDELAIEMFFNIGDEFPESIYESINCIYDKYSNLFEGKLVRKATAVANKAGDGVRKAGYKVQSGVRDFKQLDASVKRSVDPIVSQLERTINEIKNNKQKERTEQIVTGKYQFKLSSLIRRAITSLGTYVGGEKIMKTAIMGGKNVGKVFFKFRHPVMLGISLLVSHALNKRIDRKEREAVLRELEFELKMTNEKLEDAKSDGNREAKYELMRIQDRLEKDVQRIRYNLK